MSPLRNRVDPWGDLHAVHARGMFTGNRGCLVDGEAEIVRHHRGSLWITCVLAFRGRRKGLHEPGTWTPLFFLDEAVALAAGHRPCGECRVAQYRSYRDAVEVGIGRRPSATDLNRRLQSERLDRGRGLDRAADRKLWSAALDQVPAGAVVLLDDGAPALLGSDRSLRRFSFAEWLAPERARNTDLRVLTPPTSVTALANGFEPELHPSALA